MGRIWSLGPRLFGGDSAVPASFRRDPNVCAAGGGLQFHYGFCRVHCARQGRLTATNGAARTSGRRSSGGRTSSRNRGRSGAAFMISPSCRPCASWDGSVVIAGQRNVLDLGHRMRERNLEVSVRSGRLMVEPGRAALGPGRLSAGADCEAWRPIKKIGLEGGPGGRGTRRRLGNELRGKRFPVLLAWAGTLFE